MNLPELAARLAPFIRPRFAALTTPLTATSYDGNDTVVVGTVTIDTSAVFSAPVGIKGCLVLLGGTWAAASASNSLSLRPTGGSLSYGQIRADTTLAQVGLGYVTCDSNGDFDVVVAGADATNVTIRILAYWL